MRTPKQATFEAPKYLDDLLQLTDVALADLHMLRLALKAIKIFVLK